MIETILRLIDWFVPEASRKNKAEFGRARNFVFTHLFGPLMGSSIIVFLFVADPNPDWPCFVIAAFIIGFCGLPLALRVTGNLQLVATISVQNLLFVTLFGSYFYGGVSSPFLPWLLVALLLGFFYLSNRPLAVLALFAVNVTGFFAIWVWNGTFPDRVPMAALSDVGLMSVFSATLYMAWMAIYYGHLLSSESELEREVLRQRETAERLLEAKLHAERANREKSIFLAKMSHELRTPLNAVIGYSEILQEEYEGSAANEQRVEDLNRINTAGKHLLSLVTDVLDVSKIESNAMEINIGEFELRAMLMDTISTAQALMQKRNNKLVAQFDSRLGRMVSDQTRLRQVILNLLSNAAKFTENGTVTLDARRHGRSAGDWIEIEVRDTGIGIAKADAQKLFQDFAQVSAKGANRRQGTGLGLVLSQKLCGMMGGGISLESEIGKGSSFTVRLPATLTLQEASSAVAAELLEEVA